MLEVEPRPYSHMLGRCSVSVSYTPSPFSTILLREVFTVTQSDQGCTVLLGKPCDSPASVPGLAGIPIVTEVTVFCTCAAWFPVTSSQLLCVKPGINIITMVVTMFPQS